MFKDKPYLEVNREERFFCFVLGHALLASELFREGFVKLIDDKFQLRMDPSSLEVYVEVTMLRDYWNDLGDPKEYSIETHDARRSVLVEILIDAGFPKSLIDEYDFFWTTKNRKKLWSPGRWNFGEPAETTLKEAELDALKQIKWAFNCKPDLLISSKSSSAFLLIEAKLESTEGKNSTSGYRQYKIQEKVSKLIKLLVPCYQNCTFKNMALSKNDMDDSISWSEIYEIASKIEFDSFTNECFKRLHILASNP